MSSNGTPLQYSCLENSMDGGGWWAAVHGVAKSRTRLSDFAFPFHFHALETEMATHSNILAWRSQGRGSLVGCHLWGRTESDTTEETQQQQQPPLITSFFSHGGYRPVSHLFFQIADLWVSGWVFIKFIRDTSFIGKTGHYTEVP